MTTKHLYRKTKFCLSLCIMTVVMMMCGALRANAATETVTIGEGTGTTNLTPFTNYYKNGTTQMLYTAEEIGKKGEIQSIAFHVASSGATLDCTELKIYMGETDATSMSVGSPYTSSNLTLVYSATGKTIGSASGWETYTLGTPFKYSGTKNLVVAVCRKSAYYTGGLQYYYTSVYGEKVIYRQNDDYADYADIDNTSYTYSTHSNLPNVQFSIKTTDHVMDHHAAVAPTATTAGNYEYWYCATHCQKYFKDENGEEEYGDNEWVIPAGECPHQLTEHAAVPNTCGDDGNSLYYECSICGKYFSDASGDNEIEAGSWVVPADPTMHQYEGYDNGFGVCSVCGYVSTSVYEPAQYDTESQCFKIWNAGQLYWFAYNVNNATTEFYNQYYPYNAEVWDNITVNNSVLTDEGELTDNVSNLISWTPIMQYAGTFKGVNGGCISGLYCSKEDSRVGLFAKITASGTVSEVGIKDSYFSGTYNVGGIVGYNEGTIKNSYSLATVNAQSAVGGIGGSNNGNGSIQNCYSQAKVKCSGSTYGSVVGYGSAVNSYYLSDADDYWSHSGVTRVTTEQVESGEVAWLLNGSKVDETSVWGYKIDSEYWDYPLPDGYCLVWKGYMCFSNEEIFANHYLHATANHDHVYDNGFCMACEALQTPDSQTIDDVLTFDIANEGNALYVCNYVNQGNTCAARLVASNVKFTKDHCMNLTAGKLTFDLNGDTISAIYSQVINVAGCDLTITDSSEGKKGAVINGGSFAINAASGSLAINAGTFVGGGGYAVQTSSSCTSLSISGGKYFVRNGTTSRFYTSGKSALAYGYSYYNARTNEELTDKTNQPINVSNPSDTVVVKPASVKAVLTKNGVDVNYIDFDSAFSAAQQCTASDNATLKLMKNYAIVPSSSNITFSTGTFTLDLNGDTISNYYSETIKINGANVTVTDSSEDKKGAIINNGAFAFNVSSGSLAINAGTFVGNGGYAVQATSSSTSLSISGGKYYVGHNNTSRIWNTTGKVSLADGYSYFNARTGEEMNDNTNGQISVALATDTIVVKPASVKAVLTKNGEDINCCTFEAAFAAAQQCTAEDNATLKLMKSRIVDSSFGYITLSEGTFTLDLNGDTLQNCDNSYGIYVDGANLTITDSSEDKKGAIINQYGNAVYANSGSLTITDGNFKAQSYALQTTSSCTSLSVSGGTYKTMSSNYRSSVITSGKSALAEGYSYYNGNTGEELPDYTTRPIFVSADVDSIVVKPASVKAVLTKNGEDINCYTFEAAFAAAQQCAAEDNATLKLMKNYAIVPSSSNITFSTGTFTLDLNGDTISNCYSETIKINGANVTIVDSSEGKTGAVINNGAHSFGVNSGSLTIDGGSYSAYGAAYSVYSYNSEANPVIILKSGTLKNGIYHDSGATLEMPGVALFYQNGLEHVVESEDYLNTNSELTINPYYTVGTVKHKLTKEGDNYYADNFVLTDGMAFTSEYDFTAATAEYSRTMTNKWGTLCLPFALPIDDAQPYTLYNVDGVEDGVLKVVKCTSTVEAGTPVIVRRDNTANGISITAENVEVDATTHCNDWGDITLYGTYAEKTINNGYYIANDKFWDAANYNGDVTVAPYRAYMLTTLLCAKSLSIFAIDEDTTAIDSVDENEGESCADTWRTLDGKPLNGKPTKAGIYLHGNVKVVVK